MYYSNNPYKTLLATRDFLNSIDPDTATSSGNVETSCNHAIQALREATLTEDEQVKANACIAELQKVIRKAHDFYKEVKITYQHNSKVEAKIEVPLSNNWNSIMASGVAAIEKILYIF